MTEITLQIKCNSTAELAEIVTRIHQERGGLLATVEKTVAKAAPDSTVSVVEMPLVPETPEAVFNTPEVAEVPPVPSATSDEPVEVDAQGVPYDERIHGSGKSFIKKPTDGRPAGSWKLRRGADKALVAQIEGAAAQAPLVPVPPIPKPPAATAGESPAVPPAPASGAADADEPVSRPALSYADVLGRITAGVAAGTLDPMAVGAMLATNGVANPVALKDMPDKWAVVDAALTEMLAA